jgi:hypothetical protein
LYANVHKGWDPLRSAGPNDGPYYLQKKKLSHSDPTISLCKYASADLCWLLIAEYVKSAS